MTHSIRPQKGSCHTASRRAVSNLISTYGAFNRPINELEHRIFPSGLQEPPGRERIAEYEATMNARHQASRQNSDIEAIQHGRIAEACITIVTAVERETEANAPSVAKWHQSGNSSHGCNDVRQLSQETCIFVPKSLQTENFSCQLTPFHINMTNNGS